MALSQAFQVEDIFVSPLEHITIRTLNSSLDGILEINVTIETDDFEDVWEVSYEAKKITSLLKSDLSQKMHFATEFPSFVNTTVEIHLNLEGSFTKEMWLQLDGNSTLTQALASALNIQVHQATGWGIYEWGRSDREGCKRSGNGTAAVSCPIIRQVQLENVTVPLYGNQGVASFILRTFFLSTYERNRIFASLGGSAFSQNLTSFFKRIANSTSVPADFAVDSKVVVSVLSVPSDTKAYVLTDSVKTWVSSSVKDACFYKDSNKLKLSRANQAIIFTANTHPLFTHKF
jgi:hypothetical protein